MYLQISISKYGSFKSSDTLVLFHGPIFKKWCLLYLFLHSTLLTHLNFPQMHKNRESNDTHPLEIILIREIQYPESQRRSIPNLARLFLPITQPL